MTFSINRNRWPVWLGVLLLAWNLPSLMACVPPEPPTQPLQCTGTNRCMSLGDPNLNRSWSWYVDQPYTLFSKTGSSGSAILMHPDIKLPFFSADSPAASHLYYLNQLEVDMWPEEGWVLIKRDFGTATSAPLAPYFILYNRARGILRFFFYNTMFDETFSYAIVKLTHLHSDDPSRTTACLAFDDDGDRSYIDDYDESRESVTTIDVAPLSWSFADFVVGYDPRIATIVDPVFWFEVVGVDETAFTFEGQLSLNQVLDRAHVHTEFSLKDIGGAAMAGYNSYKTGRGFLAEIEQEAIKYPDSWQGGLWNDVKGLGILDAIPFVSAIAGIVDFFVGGSKSTQAIPMNFLGDMALEGVSITESPIFHVGIRVPGSATSYAAETDFEPYYDRPLGLFAVETGVKVTSSVDHSLLNCTGDFTQRCEVWWAGFTVVEETPRLVLNNIAGVEIDRHQDVEMGVVWKWALITEHERPEYMLYDDFVEIAPQVWGPVPTWDYCYRLLFQGNCEPILPPVAWTSTAKVAIQATVHLNLGQRPGLEIEPITVFKVYE